MSQKKQLTDLAVSDSGFVFDPFSGATFTVNATGLVAIAALKEGLGRAEIDARLRERFEVNGADPARDVDEFVGLLRHHGLVPADFVL